MNGKEAFTLVLLFFQKSFLRLQHLRHNLILMGLLIFNYPIINHHCINLILTSIRLPFLTIRVFLKALIFKVTFEKLLLMIILLMESFMLRKNFD